MGDGQIFSTNLRAPLLMTTYRMCQISAGSISLDNTSRKEEVVIYFSLLQFTSCFESTVLVYAPTLLLLLLLPLDGVAFAHSSYRGVPWGIRWCT
jgi:hypothetical protein